MRKPPTPRELLQAREWLRAGCPAASKKHDAAQCAIILYDLLEWLPTVRPEYAYGTPQWKEWPAGEKM